MKNTFNSSQAPILSTAADDLTPAVELTHAKSELKLKAGNDSLKIEPSAPDAQVDFPSISKTSPEATFYDSGARESSGVTKDAAGSNEPTEDLTLAVQVYYRCSCGKSFLADSEIGGRCTNCDREVSAIAFKLGHTATVSINHLDQGADFHETTEAPLDITAGTMLGHFRLERVIGRGGMGAVYRALDTSLQRFVAVKVIRPTSIQSDERVANSLREAVAQARLNHPNVVTIYYVGRHREEPFLAMELVSGPTLAEKVRSEGPLKYDAAIQILIDVVNALQHATFFGIIHADIKSSNLLLGQDGTIKLSDFGLARTTDNVDEGAVAGTPAYLAPELIEGVPISIQSDMYALGVTMFELVFGRLPFSISSRNVRELLAAQKTSVISYPTPWPANIPKGFIAVLEKLLAKQPQDRYPDYDSLLEDLRAIQPARTTIAGFAGRIIAYAVDQVMLLLCIAPFAAAIIFLESTKSEFRMLIPLIAIVSLIVPTIYLLLMRRGWSSLGRYLFQLRITEENGLPPGREQLLTREILRNMLAWFTPAAAYFSLFYSPLDYILMALIVTFLLADSICVFVFDHRRTLHDILCRSRVVLDIRKET